MKVWSSWQIRLENSPNQSYPVNRLWNPFVALVRVVSRTLDPHEPSRPQRRACRLRRPRPARGRHGRNEEEKGLRKVIRPINWLAGAVLSSALVVGCASGNFNQPDNQPTSSVPSPTELEQLKSPRSGETVIGLSFSGGGTRAAAFSYGAIEALAAHETRTGGISKSLIDDVVFVSGVSGGSVPAVYFALHGAKTIPAFRDDFLYSK